MNVKLNNLLAKKLWINIYSELLYNFIHLAADDYLCFLSSKMNLFVSRSSKKLGCVRHLIQTSIYSANNPPNPFVYVCEALHHRSYQVCVNQFSSSEGRRGSSRLGAKSIYKLIQTNHRVCNRRGKNLNLLATPRKLVICVAISFLE